MMRLAGFLLVGLVITLALLPAAHAAPAVSTLSWDAPTTRVDGTPLQATHGANAGPSCVVAHNSSGFRDRYVAGRLAIT